MPTFFTKQRGAYSYGDNLATVEEQIATRSQTSTPAGRGGRHSSGSLFDALHLTLAGIIVADDPEDPASIRAATDAFKAAHVPGPAVATWIDSDRYVMAEVSSDVRFETWKGLPSRPYSLTLTAYDDPPWFAGTSTTQSLAAGGNTITPAGTGPCDPVFVINVSSGAGTITLTDAQGNACILTVAGPGLFYVDSLQESAYTSTGVDVTGQLSGPFLRLQPGANALNVALAGTTATVSVGFQSRWY